MRAKILVLATFLNTVPPDLVELTNIPHRLMYAEENVFGKPLYSKKFKPALKPEAAKKLQRANAILQTQGFQLLVLDAYRPAAITARMWEIAKQKHLDPRLVAPPWVGSDHNRGTAVDVTLLTATGVVAIKAKPDMLGWTSTSEIEILQKAMRQAGFVGYSLEWWHYCLPNSKQYPIYGTQK